MAPTTARIALSRALGRERELAAARTQSGAHCQLAFAPERAREL